MDAKIAIGAIGAATSLGAGLIKVYLSRKESKQGCVEITVRGPDRQVESLGFVASDKLPELREIVHGVELAGSRSAAS